MGQLDEYKLSCDYIRETFDLPKDVSLYALVTKITEAYKSLKDKEELVKLKSEQSEPILKKEKKRGRPRKSNSN